MDLFNYVNRVFRTITRRKKANVDVNDFSSFVPLPPLINKQLLIEECKRQDISIYIDDHMEQCSGAYAMFRIPASEAELERRLAINKAIILSERANVIANRSNIIAFIALIVSAIPLVQSFQ